MSKYLDEYVLVIAYLLPVLTGGVTLILTFEYTSRHRFPRSKTISIAAMIFSLLNLLLYPVVLWILFNRSW